MKLLIITDAWKPQVNGVVTTLDSLINLLRQRGVEVSMIEPSQGRSLPCPGYNEIRLTTNPWRVAKQIRAIQPDAIHIATEGPLGLAARWYLKRNGIEFTTSLHTKFPEYVKARLGIPLSIGYRFLRRFHSAAQSTLVTTPSHRKELMQYGLQNLVVWGRGVDIGRFSAQLQQPAREKPVLLYVGRLAIEKNIEAFLALDIEGEKVVVGDGPQREELQKRFPDVRFEGCKKGPELVSYYQQADVFVFPSKTDTFGLVMLESLACGTPVAAYPVTGPADIIENQRNGFLHNDLATAIESALQVSRTSCREFAEDNSWEQCADRFYRSLNMLPAASWEHLNLGPIARLRLRWQARGV
jgi:glycosyltransferase involved in cell wall biosynthesis